MSKERFEWLYNETMLKHYMVDNQNNIQLGYEAIVNLLNQQNKQIADLEAKLAESEKRLVNCVDFDTWQKTAKENNELKQQLAEKEKEISNLKGLINERDKQIKNLKTNKKRVVEHKNNVKISFTLEQLEKVKKKFNGKRPIDDLANEVGLELSYTATQIQKYINNQIEELKKEMK